jgi:hypothetical protein
MKRSLDLILSPYYLATREAPAMLALALGDRVATLMPRPTHGDTREGVKSTIEHAPRYLRLMESWRWSGPLWQSGVLSSDLEGERASDELDRVYTDIDDQDAFSALRPLTRGAVQRRAESADRSLDALAADVLKGGPDPGISIPINAAIDRFAVRMGGCVVRGGASSLAQRAESRLSRRVFSVALPILLRAGGARIERHRVDLSTELGALRDAINVCRDCSPIDDPEPPCSSSELGEAVAEVAGATKAYVAAFNDWSPFGARGDDENHERVTSGYVSITGVTMPSDAVLRSSRAAMRALQGAGVGDSSDAETADPNDAPASIFSLIVREMTISPHSA